MSNITFTCFDLKFQHVTPNIAATQAYKLHLFFRSPGIFLKFQGNLTGESPAER